MKTFRYECDKNTLFALQKLTGKTFVTNKDFNIVITTLIHKNNNFIPHEPEGLKRPNYPSTQTNNRSIKNTR